jgi:hypothetical protein
MIRRKVFEDVGLLDERFGAGNGEDVEFCIRVQDAGWSIKEAGDPIKYTPNRIMGKFPIDHIGSVTLEPYGRNNRASFRMVRSGAQ